jgi:hypothetical protein
LIVSVHYGPLPGLIENSHIHVKRFERSKAVERLERLEPNGFLAVLRSARVCICLMLFVNC